MKNFFILVLVALCFVSCATTKSASTKKDSSQTSTPSKEELADLEEAVEGALSPNATRLPSSSLSEPDVKDSANILDDNSNERTPSSKSSSVQSQSGTSKNASSTGNTSNESSTGNKSVQGKTGSASEQNSQGNTSAKSYPDSSRLSENSRIGNAQVPDSSRTQNTSPKSQAPDTSQAKTNTQNASPAQREAPSTSRAQGQGSTNVSKVPDSSRTPNTSRTTTNTNKVTENDYIKNEPSVNFQGDDVSFEEDETGGIPLENILPSRTITLDKNQYLDVVYPGTGWIYLGEPNNEKHMVFFGRKLGDVNTSFTLRATRSGTAILHFYKNDVLTGKFIDDYLEVVIRDKVADTNEHIKAPEYALVVPPSPSRTQDESAETPLPTFESTPTASASDTPKTSPAENLQTEPKTAITSQTAKAQPKPSVSTNILSEDDLLERAKKAYNDKQYENAKSLLDLFFQKATTRIDEGLYLQGQVLEARSSVQNIKNAIASYDTLLKDFPESNLWKNAEKRSIYLKRMYIDIR